MPDLRPEISNSTDGLLAALAYLDWQPYLCERSLRRWWVTNGDFSARRLSDDELESHLAAEVEGTFRFRHTDKPARFAQNWWNRSVEAMCHHQRVDWFLNWLNELPTWDGEERCDHLLQWAFKVPEGQNAQLIQWASRYPVMAACKRALKPGAKLDETPVLVGEQGTGKSSYVALLLPPEWRNNWHGDSLNLAADPKQRLESCLGKVIVEVAEMVGATRAEIDSLKAFLSRTVDNGIRLAYRRNPEDIPRRFVLVGTSNDMQCLPNDAENRRFVAIEIEGKDLHEWRTFIDQHRHQVWAEAYYRVLDGEHPRLPDELKNVQREANERFRHADEVIENAVSNWLAEQLSDDAFTMIEVARGIGSVESMSDTVPVGESRRIGRALTALGYGKDRRSENGRRVTRWHKR